MQGEAEAAHLGPAPTTMSVRQLLVAGIASSIAGGALHAQFAISKHTFDSGGGDASGAASGLRGSIGQPDASAARSGGDYGLSGGFWSPAPSIIPSGGFADWAAANIAPGLDASFDGDADGDLWPNGIAYTFQGLPENHFEGGQILAPPMNPPADVSLVLEATDDLENWTTLLEYTAGVRTFVHPEVTIDFLSCTVTDNRGDGMRQFYRYEATLLP